tara:strand:- start:764 stop:1138 length:375 start_codon:yes stop_codon:yes gene_type:complete
MKKLTGEEVKEIMTEVFAEAVSHAMGEFIYTDEPDFDSVEIELEDDGDAEYVDLEAKFKSLGHFKQLTQEETTDGDAFTVYYLKDHDVYLKIEGMYNSYESCADYEDYSFKIVTPSEKTVTVYN